MNTCYQIGNQHWRHVYMRNISAIKVVYFTKMSTVMESLAVRSSCEVIQLMRAQLVFRLPHAVSWSQLTWIQYLQLLGMPTEGSR